MLGNTTFLACNLIHAIQMHYCISYTVVTFRCGWLLSSNDQRNRGLAWKRKWKPDALCMSGRREGVANDRYDRLPVLLQSAWHVLVTTVSTAASPRRYILYVRSGHELTRGCGVEPMLIFNPPFVLHPQPSPRRSIKIPGPSLWPQI